MIGRSEASNVRRGDLSHEAKARAFATERTWAQQTESAFSDAQNIAAARSACNRRNLASREEGALRQVRGAFDFILSTVAVDLPRTDYLAALRPQRTLYIVGTSPNPVPVGLYELLSGERSVVGGKTGAINDTREMLAFTARHGIAPMIEIFPMAQANVALDRARKGTVRYRAVLLA